MRLQTNKVLAAAAALAASALLVVGAGAASAAAPVAHAAGFSVRPVEIDPTNPLTRAYFILSLKPGASVTRHVVVVNSGTTDVEVLIYPVDGLTGTTSGDVYGDRSDPKRFAGRWLQHATESILVPAFKTFVAPFTVVVPRNATPGDHLAGVAVEAAQRTSTSSGHFTVTQIFREVVGVEMVVSGPAAPRLALRGAKLAALPGTNYPALTVKLADTGRKLCKPLLRVSLREKGKAQAASTVSEQLDTILPGNAIPFPFPWPRPLSAGSYLATVVATHCGRSVTLHATTSLGSTLARTPVVATVASRTIVRSAGGVSIVVLLLAFAVAGLGFGVVVSRGLRHRAARP